MRDGIDARHAGPGFIRLAGKKHRGAFLFYALSILWGLPYLLIKVAVTHVDPATIAFTRSAIGALVLAPAAIRHPLKSIVRQHWMPLVLFTICEFAVPWYTIPAAEEHLSSSATALVIGAVPLIGASLGAVTRRGDVLTPIQLVGVGVGFAGVAVVVGVHTAGGNSRSFAFLGLAALGYAAGAQALSRLTDISGAAVVTLCLALNAILLAPAGVRGMGGLRDVGATLALAALGVGCTAAGFLMYFHLIAAWGAVRATVVAQLNTASAVALGAIFLGEHIGVATVFGSFLIIGGSFAATRRRLPAETETTAYDATG